jgi:hypothetical protein
VAAYCSAAIAASMLAASACPKCDTAACPFDGFLVSGPLVLPFTRVFPNAAGHWSCCPCSPAIR